MRRAPVEELEVGEDDLDRAVGALARVAGDGGWVNCSPVVADEDRPPPPGPFAVFGALGPAVPLATYVPAHAGRGGAPQPGEAGIQHGSGRRAALRLRESGPGIPDGWRVVQDHPRRGLVVRLPEGTADGDVLRWLVSAAGALCTVPTTGRWQVTLHAPARR